MNRQANPTFDALSDIACKIRKIICNDTISNCAQVFLDATRKLNNKDQIELSLLIGSVEERVALQNNNNEWITFRNLCNESRIDIEQNNNVFSNQNLLIQGGVINNNLGKIIFTEDINYVTPSIINLEYVGRLLNGKYCLYVVAHNEPSSPQVRVNSTLQKIFNEAVGIDLPGRESIQELVANYVQNNGINGNNSQMCMYEKLFKKGIDEIIKGLQRIFVLKEIKSKNDFDLANINSSTFVTLLWFCNDTYSSCTSTTETYPYLPRCVFNKGSRCLNFLVWYADCDRHGFMRHAEIKQQDVLSPRLTKHVKMLIYKEIQTLQEQYSERLVKVLKELEFDHNNTVCQQFKLQFQQQANVGQLSLENYIKYLLIKDEFQANLEVIPLINKYFCDNLKHATKSLEFKKVDNAFSRDETVHHCLQIILSSLIMKQKTSSNASGTGHGKVGHNDSNVKARGQLKYEEKSKEEYNNELQDINAKPEKRARFIKTKRSITLFKYLCSLDDFSITDTGKREQNKEKINEYVKSEQSKRDYSLINQNEVLDIYTPFIYQYMFSYIIKDDCYIQGYIGNHALKIYIGVHRDCETKPNELLRTMMQGFQNIKFDRIVLGITGDNFIKKLGAFNNYNNLKPIEDAAKSTWLGKKALKYGFKNVKIRNIEMDYSTWEIQSCAVEFSREKT